MDETLDAIGTWAEGIGPVLQALVLLAVGAVPFLESYVGGPLGVLFGMPLVLAVLVPVVGNAAAVVVADALGRRVRSQPSAPEDVGPARRRRILGRVERWGVPLASVLAPLVLAISLTAFIMTAAGLDSRRVVVWNVVASVVWGVLAVGLTYGALATLD